MDTNPFIYTKQLEKKNLGLLQFSSDCLFPLSIAIMLRNLVSVLLCQPFCSSEFISSPLVDLLGAWWLSVPFLFIQPGTPVLNFSQPANLSTHLWENTNINASHLFPAQVLHYRHHLAPGSWAFCFHCPGGFFEHYPWELISISWLPCEDWLEITPMFLMFEPPCQSSRDTSGGCISGRRLDGHAHNPIKMASFLLTQQTMSIPRNIWLPLFLEQIRKIRESFHIVMKDFVKVRSESIYIRKSTYLYFQYLILLVMKSHRFTTYSIKKFFYFFWTSISQSEAIFCLGGMEMSGDIWSYHNWEIPLAFRG